MLIVERQHKLLEILREQKTGQLDDLALRLDVSSSTVRRDVETLEAQGLVEKTHGGVIFRGKSTSSLALDQRMQEQVDAKRAIGRAAAAYIESGMTVYLDGGSTMLYTAQEIHIRPLQIVTNSLTIANHFASDSSIELLVLGGNIYPQSGVLIGPITTQALQQIHADLMLFSTAGIFESDIYNSNLEMAEVERLALKQAARKICLLDHSKFGRKSLARVCAAEDLDLIITNAAAGERWTLMLGDRLKVAP